jgi:TolB-like protein/Flp pilus assembly protein TadD
MSDPGKAVFLSYASQDADAAKRICEALRAAGVEVWFDQSELVGGDAWDQKIRKQIRDCALLIPIISAATQARTEGYFRLEWRLADQRTHLMAKGRAFLLPVVIDDTKDNDAHVPDSFTEVQWTRLPGGEVPAGFVERVRKLLSKEVGPVSDRPFGSSASSEAGQRPALPRKRPFWLVAAIVVAAVSAAIWQQRRNSKEAAEPSARRNAATSTESAAPLSEARKLAQQAMQLLADPNSSREALSLADELSQRALALDNGDAEVWAVASFASHYIFIYNHDRSMSRWEKARVQATRASQLDPQSVSAALALLCSQTGNDNDEERRGLKRELHRWAPDDPHIIYALLLTEAILGDEAAIQKLLGELRVLPRTGWLPRALWAEVLRLRRLGRLAEAEAVVEEMFAWSGDLRCAYNEKLLLMTRGWHGHVEAETYIATIPARYRLEPAFAAEIAQYWLMRAEPNKALEALSLVVQDYLEEYDALLPKGYLTGWAHAIAGRTVAAHAEWRKALDVVDERLKTDGRRMSLLSQRALLLALTGQGQAARTAWQLRVELGGVNLPPRGIFGAEAEVFAALGEPERAITAIERGWAESRVGERIRNLPTLRYHPALVPLRDDPRIQRILAEGADMLVKLKAEQTGTKPAAGAAASTDKSALADKSVAVLAFANLSDDKSNEYFSDGISEELLNVLAKISGLKVSARTSAFYFKGKEVPIPDIARQLGVAYVVEGSVRKAGDKVRITAQLIKAADGFHVWSDTFTRDLKDIFAVQDEIAGLIAKNLEVKMGIAAARPTVDLEAYQEYLTGRALVSKAGNADLREAVGYFEKAVAIEPKFTAAWVSLASAHTQLGRWGGAPTLQSWAAARAAIDRALALEPDSPDVLLALGWIRRTAEWDWRGAEQAFRRSLKLRPNQPDALAGAAVLLFNVGQTDEAFRLGQQAAQLDPLNAATQIDLSIMFYLNHNWREAEQSARRALQLAPGGGSYRSILGWSLTAQGRYDEAEAEIARDTNESEQAQAFGSLALARGQDEVARKWLARLEEIALTQGDSSDVQMNIAWLSVGLGDRDRAFAALERARASRDPSLSWLRNSWYLESLRTDPRWPAFLRKVGLADDQLK